jgi:hypothetical protein
MPLPDTITRRWAAVALADVLGLPGLADALRRRSDTEPLNPAEIGAFDHALMSRPEWGGPAVHVGAPLINASSLPTYEPPPRFANDEPTIRFARPADHAGARVDEDGKPLDEARGSIHSWMAVLMMLSMMTMNSDAPPPTRRPGEPRGGKPAAHDVRGVLRILLALVERSRPSDRRVPTAANSVALLLWFHGFCRPDPPRSPDNPWPFVQPPNRFALRDAKGEYRKRDILLAVVEVAPWVVTGDSVRDLAKAILNLSRERHGEYDAVVRPKRGGASLRARRIQPAASPLRARPRVGRPEYDVSVAASRALASVLTPEIKAAVGQAVRAGQVPRILVVDSADGKPLPAGWKPPIDDDEVVLASRPLPPDLREGVAMLITKRMGDASA